MNLTVDVVHCSGLVTSTCAWFERCDSNQFLLNRIIDADLIGIGHTGDLTWLDIHCNIRKENLF